MNAIAENEVQTALAVLKKHGISVSERARERAVEIKMTRELVEKTARYLAYVRQNDDAVVIRWPENKNKPVFHTLSGYLQRVEHARTMREKRQKMLGEGH